MKSDKKKTSNLLIWMIATTPFLSLFLVLAIYAFINGVSSRYAINSIQTHAILRKSPSLKYFNTAGDVRQQYYKLLMLQREAIIKNIIYYRNSGYKASYYTIDVFHNGEGGIAFKAVLNLDLGKTAIKRSSKPMSVAIESEGFFILEDEEGSIFYGRNGDFYLDKGNALAVDEYRVYPTVVIPKVVSSDIKIRKDGRVEVYIAHFGSYHFVGRIRLASVEKDSLIPFKNVFKSDSSDKVKVMKEDKVFIRQGFLESSSVYLEKEIRLWKENIMRRKKIASSSLFKRRVINEEENLQKRFEDLFNLRARAGYDKEAAEEIEKILLKDCENVLLQG